MRLPADTTCGDGHHIRRCKPVFGHTETDSYCDCSPSRFVLAKVKCERCMVGMIGDRPIFSDEWANAADEMARAVDYLNEKKKRFTIQHTGFANKFIYCTRCGTKVKGEGYDEENFLDVSTDC